MLIWGITDGSAGMASQVRGVGELLEKRQANSQFILKTAKRMWPLSILPATWWKGSLWLKTFSSDRLRKPWPDLVITSGRRSVAFALAIKHASGGKAKLVHLQTPRAPLDLFDLVIPMEHDDVSADNIFPTFAALHHITNEKLGMAAYELQNEIDRFKAPRIAFFIGGSTNKYQLNAKRMARLLTTMSNFIRQYDGSVFISTSRRTGENNIESLKKHFSEKENMWIYAGGDKNPYLAWLASADAIVVTNDSVNMMSEALATGKPLYILPLPDHTETKPARFARQLISRGMAKPLNMPLQHYDAEIHNECTVVVDEILQLFK